MNHDEKVITQARDIGIAGRIGDSREARLETHEQDRKTPMEEDACEYCGGTGEIDTAESVYGAGEPHMALIGIRACVCRIRDEDDYDRDE